MTHQPLSIEFATAEGLSSSDAFSIRRSDFLDAFARLEANISRIIVASDPQFDPRIPFGNKLKLLGQLKASNLLSKKAIDRFASLPGDIATLTRIRNDLGHGLMSLIYRNSEAVAAFQNAADFAVDFPQFTLLSVDDFNIGRKRLLQFANELKKLTNPPSPPQPSPAAATGP
jgi:hypothetical protein